MPNIGGLHTASWPTKTFSSTRTLSSGKAAFESRMMLIPEHCSTHLDVPRHFDEGGATLSEVPLQSLVLPGHLLDFTHKKNGEAITIDDFEKAETKSGRPIG